MSFASDVKKELTTVEVNECCYKAELYSIVRHRAQLRISRDGFKIVLETTLNAIARRIVYLFKEVYNVKASVSVLKPEVLNQKNKYVITIKDDDFKIMRDLKVMDDNYSFIVTSKNDFFKNDCCKASIVRGAFLAKGSINDPSKSHYHLEVLSDNYEGALLLVDLLADVGIEGKIIEREKGFVVYLKKAEQIGDFLKFVGAVTSLFNFEDQRIKRDYNNYVNRLINCDIANEQKAIASAAKQLENINYLNRNHGLLNLSSRLIDAIVLRTNFPDYSLSQLSEESEATIGRYISKSGLSHCFRDIEKACEEIRRKQNKSTT